MIEWKISTVLPEVGRVVSEGKRERRSKLGIFVEEVVFYHPTDEGALILSLSEERLEELYRLPAYQKGKLNFVIERREIYVGMTRPRTEMETTECPDCGDVVMMVDKDFLVHALPQCDGWNRRNQR